MNIKSCVLCCTIKSFSPKRRIQFKLRILWKHIPGAVVEVAAAERTTVVTLHLFHLLFQQHGLYFHLSAFWQTQVLSDRLSAIPLTVPSRMKNKNKIRWVLSICHMIKRLQVCFWTEATHLLCTTKNLIKHYCEINIYLKNHWKKWSRIHCSHSI